MHIQFRAMTDEGRVREHNEDNFLVDRSLKLFVVCDGMGGHAAGEVASAMSAQTVHDVVREGRQRLEALVRDPGSLDHQEAIIELMRRSVQLACQRIFQRAQLDPSQRGMGTTTCALAIVGDHGFIAHVGDSRIYLLRNGVVSQMTEDHSLLNEMIRQGKIRPGEGQNFPHKNAVTRAVGVRETVEVDAFEFEVEPGDRYLVCSDGLCGYFDDHDHTQVGRLMAIPRLQAAAQQCIDFANGAGGKDNITAILVETCDEQGARQMEQEIDVLRGLRLFRYLTTDELELVRDAMERQSVKPDEVFVDRQGLQERMFVVVRGAVALHQQGRKVAVIGPGQSFAELVLVDPKAVELTACALESTEVLSLSRSDFAEILREEPDMAPRAMWGLLEDCALRLQHVPYDLLHDPALWRTVSVEPGMGDATPPPTRMSEAEVPRASRPPAFLPGTEANARPGNVTPPPMRAVPPRPAPAAAAQSDDSRQRRLTSQLSEDDLRSTVQLDIRSPGALPWAEDAAPPGRLSADTHSTRPMTTMLMAGLIQERNQPSAALPAVEEPGSTQPPEAPPAAPAPKAHVLRRPSANAPSAQRPPTGVPPHSDHKS